MLIARQQQVNPWGEQAPSYLDFISFWDSGWYKQISHSGYPRELPQDQNGTVLENPWAFYPLFPMLVSIFYTGLGLSYQPVAALLATASGFVAAYLIYRLFLLSLKMLEPAAEESSAGWLAESKESLALWALAAFAFLPVSPILQVPYAESLNLIFLTGTLLLLMRARWWAAAGLAVFACLSRPVGVPLGATAGIYWLFAYCRLYRQYRAEQAEDKSLAGLAAKLLRALGSSWQQLVSALLICAWALLWPLFAWLRTGRIDAYTATETAWRASNLEPVLPWLLQAEKYFGAFGLPVLILLLLAFVLLLRSRLLARYLHPLLISWCALYGLYLLLFLNPQSSLFRLLLPLFPLCLALVAISTSRAYRVLLVLTGAVLQFGWLGWLWHWKPLPGGGDYPP